MSKVLFIYATREGQTEKIVNALATDLTNQSDVTIDKVNLRDQSSPDLDKYDLIVIGCSIRYGYYPKLVRKFIDEHSDILNNKKSVFFGVNLVARKPLKNTPTTNFYTKKFLENISWRPTLSAVFAGALYYPRYSWYDRIMIQFIMWIGKGETDTSKEIVEYTDWNRVKHFASEIKELL